MLSLDTLAILLILIFFSESKSSVGAYVFDSLLVFWVGVGILGAGAFLLI
jgi:hypothetical protein